LGVKPSGKNIFVNQPRFIEVLELWGAACLKKKLVLSIKRMLIFGIGFVVTALLAHLGGLIFLLDLWVSLIVFTLSFTLTWKDRLIFLA
jgi:hypothetical protein